MRRGNGPLLLALLLLGTCVSADFFDGFFGRPRLGPQTNLPSAQVTGRAFLQPENPVVGEQAALHVELTVEKDVGLENVQVGGLPDANDDILYGEGFENLTDISLPSNRVLKRLCLPVRFLLPRTNDVVLLLQGYKSIRQQKGGFSSLMQTGFRINLPPLLLKVRPLPQEGRPDNFSGAVGPDFRITQTLSSDHVRPGDLVTATYRLTWDGHFPSNVWPTIEHLSREFKVYDPKEVERTTHSAAWTQVLVPRTTAATNTALVSVNFYNPRTKRYEVTRAAPRRLIFISAEAASTENTAVVVTTEPSASSSGGQTGERKSGPLVLHFAPNENSPVVITLPSGTSVREIDRVNGWRRLACDRAIGWAR